MIKDYISLHKFLKFWLFYNLIINLFICNYMVINLHTELVKIMDWQSKGVD